MRGHSYVAKVEPKERARISVALKNMIDRKGNYRNIVEG